ncbi:MAG: MotA/TolQ/ExbB proton channel family protein [Planctomycetes bacterium]|nr:MotA/TolQ/ExbB proton channel family protein [Planctomycetota bacterium]MBI3845089.1 MotA/TolQ/ExbB proton channel family protein [Planctomycetota bacterium]
MKANRKALLISLALLFLFVVAPIAFGAEGEPNIQKKSWLQLFETTGFVGILMLVVSMIGTALVIENSVNLRREKLAPTPLAQELEALIDEEKYDEAIEVCDVEGGYLSNLIGAALRMRHAGYEDMIGGLESAAAEETFKLQAKISYLSLLGNVAPLLGLLGTVTGMISSFQAIEALKAPTPGDLAKGVYESLVNTTMGLFIAIIFLTAYFFVKNKVTKMTLSMNLQAVDLLKHLAATKSGH